MKDYSLENSEDSGSQGMWDKKSKQILELISPFPGQE